MRGDDRKTKLRDWRDDIEITAYDEHGPIKVVRLDKRWTYHQSFKRNWPVIFASIAFYAVLIALVVLISARLIWYHP